MAATVECVGIVLCQHGATRGRTKQVASLHFRNGYYLVNNAEIVDQANGHNGDPLLFTKHGTSDQKYRAEYAAPLC